MPRDILVESLVRTPPVEAAGRQARIHVRLVICELVLDHDKDNQPLGRSPGPPPGGKKAGMKKGYTFPPKDK